MVPVFIGLQVKRALRASADETALSDITKKRLVDRILARLEIEKGGEYRPCQIKGIMQDDMTLSIKLAPESAHTTILREQGKRWSLIIRKDTGENQTEFIFDTYRKIDITFG